MVRDSEKLTYAIWLSGLAHFASLNGSIIKQLIEFYGDLGCVYYATSSDLQSHMNVPSEKRDKAIEYIESLNIRKSAEESALCHSNDFCGTGIKAVIFTDTDYPKKLLQIHTCPSILYYSTRNDLKSLNSGLCAAVIGTRSPSYYGIRATEHIIEGFRGIDVKIISGLARGIDGIAHEKAIQNDLLTVAVLGCGIDIAYPPENADLMTEIVNKGIVMSECPPGTKPARQNFPARNRIISGLSDCVIVTEASLKSGTMITAGYAADQGRDVYAVPGNIFSNQSEGTNRLIADGAGVLTCADDILKCMTELEMQYIKNILCNGQTKMNVRNEKAADIENRILYTIRNISLSIDEIAQAVDETVENVSAILAVSEICGRVVNSRGRFILTDSTKSGYNKP